MKDMRRKGLRLALAVAALTFVCGGCELVDIGDETSSVTNTQDDHSINQGDEALPERAVAATNGLEVVK